ncbi:MAG: hypothetical protein GW903_09745 [Alphaproteobacteria bacterium]|nr:hypothetical protein [Alphaproteobacteria bacterium]NCQ89288.1 hypothetical protein [Alphaproteobacteria bacterium]NCT08152.1 hypothetical protein [Alphaproteobacteria bacterium]
MTDKLTQTPVKAVMQTSMPSKADKRADALRENLKKRKALVKDKIVSAQQE